MKNYFAANTSLLDSKPFRVPLTTVACAVCVMILVALNLVSEAEFDTVAANLGYLPDSVIWEGKPWVLLTSTFVHFEIWHVLFNVYWLWILGSCLEESVGTLRWFLFFLGAAWVSSSAELLLSGNSGIGMSGVGYALFGFGWIARRKLQEFAIVHDQTVQLFLVWLVACGVLTQVGLMNIANWAHLFGLLFGVSVAAVFVLRWRLPLTIPALTALLAVSFLPLKWCPMSPDWTSKQAFTTQRGTP